MSKQLDDLAAELAHYGRGVSPSNATCRWAADALATLRADNERLRRINSDHCEAVNTLTGTGAELDRKVAKLRADNERLRETLEAEAPEALAILDELATLRADNERLRAALAPVCSGADWGSWLAWLIAGAPDRKDGIAAAKRIVSIQCGADAAIRENEKAPANPAP